MTLKETSSIIPNYCGKLDPYHPHQHEQEEDVGTGEVALLSPIHGDT